MTNKIRPKVTHRLIIIASSAVSCIQYLRPLFQSKILNNIQEINFPISSITKKFQVVPPPGIPPPSYTLISGERLINNLTKFLVSLP